MSWNERTKLLLREERFAKLSNSHVLVVGLGGVGAYAAEQLARAGIGSLTLVDADNVEVSNINRQLIALHSTIGMPKTELLQKRLLDINPEIKLTLMQEFLRDERMVKVLQTPFDYVVDAIDTLAPKTYLIYHSLKNNIPLVSSMGSGGRMHPELVQIADISKTHHCTLARMLRKRLGKLGIRKGFQAVFSPEEVKEGSVIEEKGQNKASNVGTISYMPAVFGCFCASVVVNGLANNHQ